MKHLITNASAALLCCSSAFARWVPAPLKSLVEDSDCVVVAEFVSEDSRKVDGQRIDQDVTLKVTSVIKGEAPEQVRISGYEDPKMCKAQFVFPTTKGEKYLIFLRKNEGKYTVVNGIFGALTITDDQVKWFTDETKMQVMEDRKLATLKSAIAAIQKAGLKSEVHR